MFTGLYMYKCKEKRCSCVNDSIQWKRYVLRMYVKHSFEKNETTTMFFSLKTFSSFSYVYRRAQLASSNNKLESFNTLTLCNT